MIDCYFMLHSIIIIAEINFSIALSFIISYFIINKISYFLIIININYLKMLIRMHPPRHWIHHLNLNLY